MILRNTKYTCGDTLISLNDRTSTDHHSSFNYNH